jgi:anti-repressor protein
MNELQVFKSDQFGQIRTASKNGEPLFVAADVCRALGLDQVTRAMSRLDEDERALLKVTHPQNADKSMVVNGVTEPGLYHLVLCSTKPEAKAFKRWITHEVIPTIRKHGAYMTTSKLEEVMNDPDAWITMLTALKDEREARKALEVKTAADAPKVLFADAVTTSHTSILVGELAKIVKQNGVDMGQNRLFEWLRSNGYLIRRQGTDYNMPTQRSMELGLFEIKETAVTHSDGHTTVSKTPKVTGKGQCYFIARLLGETA